MRASEIMSTGAAIVRPDASLGEAARIMAQHHVSGLPVLDENGKLVGVITEGVFYEPRRGAVHWPLKSLQAAAPRGTISRRARCVT